jgi:hypothetical protein
MFDNLIPANTHGKPSDLEFTVTLPNLEAAGNCFQRAVKRMLNPPIWHELAGWGTAHFTLIGEDGQELKRLAAEGDYLRIDIPGPGPAAGDGYDWVKVELLEDHPDSVAEEEWTGMRVRPSPGPGRAAMEPAHFFRGDATSSFIIYRNGLMVTAFYHGRNEIPNTVTEKMADNIRNAIVATGAILSLSEIQWSALSKGFLSEEIGG